MIAPVDEQIVISRKTYSNVRDISYFGVAIVTRRGGATVTPRAKVRRKTCSLSGGNTAK